MTAKVGKATFRVAASGLELHLGVAMRAALLFVTLTLSPLALAAQPRTVFVTYFENTSKDVGLKHFEKGLADMLISDLSQVPSLRLVEREKLDVLQREIGLSKTAYFDPKTAQRLGRGVGASHALTGSFLVDEDRLRIDARLVEVESGKVVLSRPAEGKRQDIFEIEKDLVAEIVRALEVEVDWEVRRALRAHQTQSFEALRQYGAGLAAKDSGDSAGAAEKLQAALKADPQFARAKVALESLGSRIKAREDASKSEFERELAALDPKSPDVPFKLLSLVTSRGGATDQVVVTQNYVKLLTFITANKIRGAAQAETLLLTMIQLPYVNSPLVAAHYAESLDVLSKKYPELDATQFAYAVSNAKALIARGDEAKRTWEFLKNAGEEYRKIGQQEPSVVDALKNYVRAFR